MTSQLVIPPVVIKPYCEQPIEAMTLEQWLGVPVRRIRLDELVPSQPGLVIDRFTAIATGGPREGDDLYPYSVAFRGVTYLHNGHHWWAIALARGARTILTRVQQADRACGDCWCGLGERPDPPR